jgi:hypothetical protein
VTLLAFEFSKLDCSLGMTLVDPDRNLTSTDRTLSAAELRAQMTVGELHGLLSAHDLKRVELYGRSMVRTIAQPNEQN